MQMLSYAQQGGLSQSRNPCTDNILTVCRRAAMAGDLVAGYLPFSVFKDFYLNQF